MRILPITLATTLLSAVVQAAPPTIPVDRSKLEPFMAKYCYQCHGEEEQEADLRFDTADWDITDNESAQYWQDILDVLNSGEMPPEDEPQPKEKEFTTVLGILTKDLDTARKRLAETGGVNTIRRINRREYINTIKHLFGLNIDSYLIPEDLRSEHFDTAGAEQYFDAALLEQFVRIGTEITKEGFKWSDKPYDKPKTIKYEAEKTKGHAQTDLERPNADKGYYLDRGNRKADTLSVNHGKDPRASYKFRVHAGVVDPDTIATRHFVTVSSIRTQNGNNTGANGIIKINGTLDSPATEEITVTRFTLGQTEPRLGITEVTPIGITNSTRWIPKYLAMIGATPKTPNIWVDYVEVEGPFYDSESNIFGSLISPNGKRHSSKKDPKKFLEKFAYEAFRKVKPSPKYINKLHAYYKAKMAEGLKYEDAMSQTVGLILASPGFLYLEENQAPRSEDLNPRAFATRLSYFLWSAPPDEELYKLAESKKLLNEDVLKEQIDRMLKDPRAESFYEGFMGQWAYLERLEDISVDWRKILPYNDGIRYSSYREPIEFFKTLVEQNIGADNLIDSDFVVIDPLLAHYYGIKKAHSTNEFKAVKLPKNSPRGGLITQSAFLTIGSTGDRTSPVIRGTIILEKLLNNPPPPPPPNVPEIGSASKTPISNRKLVEMHRKQKVCASCHDKIDPIGFGLENFDSIGLWRKKETVGDKEVKIDTSAKLVSGVRFKTLEELQKLLKSQTHKLARNLSESLVGYGIGRPVEFSDKEDIDAIAKQAKADKYNMRDLIFHVANSKTFRTK